MIKFIFSKNKKLLNISENAGLKINFQNQKNENKYFKQLSPLNSQK